MKLTLTNRGTGGKRLWTSDTGITCIHSNDNGIETMSIVAEGRLPSLEEITEARYTIMSEVLSFAIVLGPSKKYKKNNQVVTLIEHKY